jgi:O-antigen/teichoic acid export membrane protein
MAAKPSESIFRQVLFSGLWTLGLRLSNRALGFVRTIVLARLLFPADFGLIAMAMVVVNGLDSISQTGFQQALIQKKRDVEGYLDTAWAVALVRSLVLCVLLVLAAPFVADFFAVPELTDILRVVSLSVLLGGFANIGIVFFQKDLEFHKQFNFEWWASVLEFVLTILLAYILRDVWALVWGGLAGNILRVFLSYRLHPYRPSLRFDAACFRELMRFGKWVSGYAVLLFAAYQMDSILVGKLLGVDSLGFYQMAYLTAVIPSSEVAIAFSMVMFPSFAMLQDQPGRLRVSFEKGLQVSAMVCMPIGFGIFAIAPEFVRVALGERWQGIALIMQALSVVGMAKALEGTMNSLMMAVGRPGIVTGLSAVQLAILAAAVYPCISLWGLEGAAFTVAGTAMIAVAAAFGVSCRITQTPAARGAVLLAVPLIASAAMAATVMELKCLAGPARLTALLSLSAAGIVLYAAFLVFADAALTSGRYRSLLFDITANLLNAHAPGVAPSGSLPDGAAPGIAADERPR